MSATERVLGRFLRRLRFPQLFLLTTVVFVVDLVIPDMVPLADEILLGLLSLLLGSLRERGPEEPLPGGGRMGEDARDELPRG